MVVSVAGTIVVSVKVDGSSNSVFVNTSVVVSVAVGLRGEGHNGGFGVVSVHVVVITSVEGTTNVPPSVAVVTCVAGTIVVRVRMTGVANNVLVTVV